MTAHAPIRLPSAADHYSDTIFPLAMQSRAALNPDLALAMQRPEDAARRAALGFALALAEHAADQADDPELRALMAALIAGRRAVGELLNGYDTDAALDAAEDAATAIHEASIALVAAWGLEQ